MPGKVWTVAIWLCAERRWVAALTSPVRSRAKVVVDVLQALRLPVFVALVEVERDSVELIEQCVAALEPVSALDAYVALLEEKDFVEEEAQAVARAAVEALRVAPTDIH